MSVYIPGMEMPKGCAFCKISRRNGKKMICPFIWKCEWDFHDPMSADHRLDGCPLVLVPPHGRLIDADAFERRCMFDSSVEDMQDVIYALRDYPTIIPASFENLVKSKDSQKIAADKATTIIPADGEGEG